MKPRECPGRYRMKVSFYRTYSSKNVVRKLTQPVEPFTREGSLKESCSIVDPIITFSGHPNTVCNYVYIPAFDRWYYVEDTIILSNNKYQYKLHCDVLMSFADAISGCTAYVEKADQSYGLGLVNAGVNPPELDQYTVYGKVENGPTFVPNGGFFLLTIAG